MNTVEKTVPATGITVYTDKNGVTREYREVKRKAAVGELVKVSIGFKDIVDRVCAVIENETGFEWWSEYGVETDSQWSDGSTLNPTHDEYVVLEPTNIVHHDGKRYREVKRRANVGELVLVHRNDTGHDFAIGEIVKCSERQDDEEDVFYFLDVRDYWYMRPGEYTVLESVTEPHHTEDDRLTALEQRVAALEAKLSPVTVTIQQPTVNVVSKPSYTRADVIELAKKDVEELVFHGKDDRIDNFDVLQGSRFYGRFYTVDFRVDRPKRTVVALISDGTRNRRKPDAIGKSKSAPDDCFNVHIGKAIALRRALGLDVPDYYVNAPKPTEAQVGDIVTWSHVKHLRYHVTGPKYVGGNCRYFEYGRWNKASGDDFAYAIILDDSHDFGGEAV